MLKLEELRNDATLPEEEWQILRQEILTAVRDRLVGRQWIGIQPVPAITQEYGYDRVSSEFADAQVIGKGGAFPRDMYDTGRVTLKILKIGDGFQIPREDYLQGTLRTQSVEQMTRRIAEKEDKIIFDGDALFLPSGGAIDFAGNTRDAGTSPAWDTATVTAIYDDFRLLFGEMEADKFAGPYSIVVPAAEMKNLRKYDSTGQVTALQLLLGDEGNTAGLISRLLVSYGITDGNVLAMQDGSGIAALVMAEDLTVEEPVYIQSHQRFEGNVYERLVPVFYQYGPTAGKTDAVGKIFDL